LCGEKKYILVSITERTAASGRKVADILIGVLKNVQTPPEKSFLLSFQETWAVNHIAAVVREDVHTLWVDVVQFGNVLLLVTYAAAYMKESAGGLAVSYPKLIHVTWVAHILVRVRKTIGVLHPNVDKLVAIGNKTFLKFPARIQLFKNKARGTLFPQNSSNYMLGNRVGYCSVLCRKH
jgi:hypothetical protein